MKKHLHRVFAFVGLTILFPTSLAIPYTIFAALVTPVKLWNEVSSLRSANGVWIAAIQTAWIYGYFAFIFGAISILVRNFVSFSRYFWIATSAYSILILCSRPWSFPVLTRELSPAFQYICIVMTACILMIAVIGSVVLWKMKAQQGAAANP